MCNDHSNTRKLQNPVCAQPKNKEAAEQKGSKMQQQSQVEIWSPESGWNEFMLDN